LKKGYRMKTVYRFHWRSVFYVFGVLFSMAADATPVAVDAVEAEGIDPDRLRRLDTLVDTYITERRVPGMTVLISRNGKIVYEANQGVMGLDNPAPIAADTIYRIYSMTKAVTAVAALILYEEGRFHLYDPVAKYLPEFADMQIWQDGQLQPAQRPITMHQLFTHTAGLSYGFRGDHPLRSSFDALALEKSPNLAEFTRRLAKLPLVFEPGTAWGYSYASEVLGAVVAKLSGQSLEAFLQARLFKPLNMRDTSFELVKNAQSRLASSHIWHDAQAGMTPTPAAPQNPGYRLKPYDSGGMGLFSTARDYLNFLEMLRAEGRFGEQQILSPKTVKFMTKDHLPRRITDANIGPDHDPVLGLGGGHGLGIGVYIDPVRRGVLSSVGENNWGGVSGTVYWLDTTEELVVVAMVQLFNSPWRLRDDLSVGIYQALSKVYE